MKTRAKVAASILVAVAVVSAGVAYRSVDARELGRSNPGLASFFWAPSFNFSATYTDGVALGVKVGSTKAEAIRAAEGAGFKVSTSGWGDNRAGQSELYERSVLVATMLRQPYLSFDNPDDLSGGMIVNFSGDRVSSVRVYYVNFEGP